ncbi:hypothetical protein EP7_004287 [Isosphaeraceae bacterium EP7]
MLLGGAWIALCGFLSQFLQEHSEEVRVLIISLLPLYLKGYAGAAVGIAVGALTTWLKKRNTATVLEAKRDALATVPPPDIEKYY